MDGLGKYMLECTKLSYDACFVLRLIYWNIKTLFFSTCDAFIIDLYKKKFHFLLCSSQYLKLLPYSTNIKHHRHNNINTLHEISFGDLRRWMCK